MRISSTFCTVAVAVIAAAGVSIASAAQLKEGVQTPPGEHEVALRRELAAARAELDAMQRGARDASAHAHALAAKQAQILKEQQQIDEALETAQRVIEDFRAEAILWDRERAAEVHPPMEASQLAAKRALDEERHKVELLEQELITARQTIDALKTGANLAAVEKTNAIKDRSVAEPALKQVEEALELERERADSAVRDLDIVRKERDASKQISAELSAALDQERERAIGLGRSLSAAREAADSAVRDLDIVRKERDASKQVSAELSAALDQERERATGLARSLSAAREAIDIVKDKRRTAALERAPKSRTPLASTLSRSGAQPARKPGLPKKQKVKVKKSPHPVLPATIALPAALLPTRPLNSSTYASED
jgi:hypothetical protein